jgi:L-asparagine oxygenase
VANTSYPFSTDCTASAGRRYNAPPSHLEEHGFAFLAEFQPGIPTLTVAESLGNVLRIPGIPVVQRICPKPKEMSSPNLYSGNYGLGQFPLHTDLAHWYLPPRYLVLRCIRPATGVLTVVEHHASALAGISPIAIRRALYRPRRKSSGKICLLRLMQPFGTRVIFRWDPLFITPANNDATEIANYLRSHQLDRCANRFCFNQSSDTLLIDNWTTLHGRTSVSQADLGRIVERVYLTEIKS